MIERERLIVALDTTDRKRLLRLADDLENDAGLFKMGSVAFSSHGPDLVREVATRRPVFLDLKFHDIPNTVAGAVRAAAELGIEMLTVHAAGGNEMVRAAVEAAPRVRVLAVTVLTHLQGPELNATGVADDVETQVVRLARLAVDAGAAGIVCSPQEVGRLRRELGPEVALVVPGVRPSWAHKGDQRRAQTPAEAIAAGADYLVVGRPILDADDPLAATRRILSE